ncbi:MAG TPA: serine/threonine-protein kinase [Myxococcota bacterium]|nr:serine/threonine-protein kinase [Myxococcota bacterium]
MPDALRPEELERIGRFKVRRYLAGGGMAWVFEVEDPGLFDARRALKLLKPGETDAETLRRFRREAELLSRLQHPNLVHIFEFGEDAATGCQYYTMDFIEGRTLAQIHPDWLDATPDGGTPADARSLDEICRYFSEVLSALARLHEQGIVHRDIKPQNVFVDPHGRAVLGDLGVAKLSSAAGETQKGVVPGTPLYMAPEQSLRFEASTRTDLFSLGLSMYRVLSGRTVYDNALGADSTNSMAVLRHLWSLQGASQEFEFEFPPQVPEPLRAVVRQACRMSPDERYPSAETMADAIRGATRPPRAAELAEPRRGPSLPVLALLGMVVLALGFWFGLGSYSQRSGARTARSSAEAAHAQVSALVGGLSGRTSPGAADAIEDAKRRVEYAAEEQNEAEEALQSARYGAAQDRFERALDGYTRACQSIVDHWLRAEASASVESAVAAVAALGSASGDLATRAKGLPEPSPDTGCNAAEAERARLFAAEAVRADAVKIAANAPLHAEPPPPAPAPPAAVVAAAAPEPEPAPAAPPKPAPVAAAPPAQKLPPVAAAPAAAAASAAPAPSPAPAAAKAPAHAPGSRPPVRDNRAAKAEITQALESWNAALNARDWNALAQVQNLHPGQLEAYQKLFPDKSTRQSMAIDFIAGFDSPRIDVQIVLTREERHFFVWRVVAKETRKGIATRDGTTWKLEGL